MVASFIVVYMLIAGSLLIPDFLMDIPFIGIGCIFLSIPIRGRPPKIILVPAHWKKALLIYMICLVVLAVVFFLLASSEPMQAATATEFEGI
jgi:hypothetical protein